MLRHSLVLSFIPILLGVLIAGGIGSMSQPENADSSSFVQTALPQIELSQTYRSDDGSLTFHSPQGWFATDHQGGRVDLENTPYEKRIDRPDALRLEVSSPIDVAELSMMGQGSTPAE